MTDIRVAIAGMGLVTPLGEGVEQNWSALLKGQTGFGRLTLFPAAPDLSFPVGECSGHFSEKPPRTHRLALMAAREALCHGDPPDAVILGTTTGGMNRTEELLKEKAWDPSLYAYHGAGSVAEYLAEELTAKGPAITVSTACSSGALAIALAYELLKTGRFKRVLAGGAESLCRLTYHGFHSLQLIDSNGSHPLDRDRKGLTVSEGAGFLLLEATSEIPDPDSIFILGAGLTCDAFHPASPEPEGKGAFSAMKCALKDAGLSIAEIDYVNLHGTGTIDNDSAEAKAFHRLFDGNMPPVSSVKGAFGHSLSAAGAIEAVISAKCIASGIVPASTGCRVPDPRLNMAPLREATCTSVGTVLSNAFGFGGSNVSLVIGKHGPASGDTSSSPTHFEVAGIACLTGAGNTQETLDAFMKGSDCRGQSSIEEISRFLSPRTARRLKRLSRMGLSIAMEAVENAIEGNKPGGIFFGTGWGALSETHDFLTQLYETDERFGSPTDFMGSVHNATTGRIAVKLKAEGPNITTTGGDYSFEQALMAARLFADKCEQPLLVMGADEFHPVLSRLLDPSVESAEKPSDGGGGLLLNKTLTGNGPIADILFYENANRNPRAITSLIDRLGGAEAIQKEFGAVFTGLPAETRETGEKQLDLFLQTSGFGGPVIDYRRHVGEFASASAVAAVLGVVLLRAGQVPAALTGRDAAPLEGKEILILGLGNYITALSIHDSKGSP